MPKYDIRDRKQNPPMGPYLLGEFPKRLRKGQMDTTRLGYTAVEALKMLNPSEMAAVKYTPPIPTAVDPKWQYKELPRKDLQQMKSKNLMDWLNKYFGK